MNETKLDLLVLEKNGMFYLWDISEYNPDLPRESGYLHITPPNFTGKYTVVQEPNKMLPLNGESVFGVSCDLVDGNWCFEQENPKSTPERKKTNYFKISNLITQIVNKANEESCNIPESLYDMVVHLEMAKRFAELFCEVKKANIIYDAVRVEFEQTFSGCKKQIY